MPFNNNNQYEPSKTLITNLKEFVSEYLNTTSCKQEEYEKILGLLSSIEDSFYKQGYVLNNDSNLTFKEKRNKRAEALKQYAVPKIVSELHNLQQKRMKYNINEENQDWIKYNNKEDKIVEAIWIVWYYEREHRPRVGIILLYLDASESPEVLVTKYQRNDCIVYGFAKGKIEFGETIWDCAAREAAEELGLDAKITYDQIKDSTPIKKNVFNLADKSSIEHYYFIIPVPNKNINLTLNEQEVDDIEWHTICTLPCCNKCQIKQPICRSKKSNYFMVACTNRDAYNSLVRDIFMHIDKKNGNELASQKYKDIHRLCPHH